ncbi:MAG: sugar phosphate isomerase/epimerase [Clostridiales bacterium]|nr:sugar phosphate isomerase/epimerase [Clostridiales bacterium]
MFKTGLVSISFRNLSPEEIIEKVVLAGLNGIEWGGDVHVPTGDIDTAVKVGKSTRTHGLEVSAYGSYYRVGCHRRDAEERFDQVLRTAAALGAPIVRVWAYNKGSADITVDEYNYFIEDARSICKRAKAKGIKVAFECHNNTLTDDYIYAQRMLSDIDEAFMYWQPNQYRDDEYNLKAVEALLPWITNVHVFHWTEREKLPLCKGATLWEKYLNILKKSGQKHTLELEFMPDGKIETLTKEAETLKCLVAGRQN